MYFETFISIFRSEKGSVWRILKQILKQIHSRCQLSDKWWMGIYSSVLVLVEYPNIDNIDNRNHWIFKYLLFQKPLFDSLIQLSECFGLHQIMLQRVEKASFINIRIIKYSNIVDQLFIYPNIRIYSFVKISNIRHTLEKGFLESTVLNQLGYDT